MTRSKLLLLTPVAFIFTACSPKEIPVSEGGYYHSGVYFGAHFTKAHKKGIKDGCATSKGTYTKSHTSFQNKKEYADGWFLGRNKCRHLLVVEEK